MHMHIFIIVILLCTLLSSTTVGISGVSRAGEVKAPTHVKMPSCDVRSGSKVSVDVENMSSTVEETVMSFPLATATPLMVHVAVGELIKPATVFDTVQFRLYIIPALAVPDLLTLAMTASEGTEEGKVSITYNIRALQQ